MDMALIHWYRASESTPDDFVAERMWLKGCGCPNIDSIIFMFAEITASDEVLITASVSERTEMWFEDVFFPLLQNDC
jgi:hypothetical protein